MFSVKILQLTALLATLASGLAFGLTVNPTFTDGAGETWDATRQGVINYAIDAWEATIDEDESIDVTFQFTNAGTGGYLGQWAGSLSYSVGDNIRPWYTGLTHTVSFNADLFTGTNYTWWDPSPADGSDQPSEAWDALSVATHELGHMMGFSDIYKDDIDGASEVILWSAPQSGGYFDPSGLNVDMDDDGVHVDQSLNDLMSPGLVNGIRRDISQMDLDMLALAYSYNVAIPEPMSISLLALGALAFLRRRR